MEAAGGKSKHHVQKREWYFRSRRQAYTAETLRYMNQPNTLRSARQEAHRLELKWNRQNTHTYAWHADSDGPMRPVAPHVESSVDR